MRAPEITVTLAEDEPSVASAEAQVELTALSAEMRRYDPELASLETVQKHVGHVSKLLGEWVASKDLLESALVGIIGALSGWMTAKAGRKVSLKIGDVEASASSVGEIERLLKLAEKHRPPSQ